MTFRDGLPFASGLMVALVTGWIGVPRVLYQQIDQPIQFSHKTHSADQAGLSCEDCHTLGEDGRFSGIPSIENCAGCHSEVIGESDEEKKLVREYVGRGREISWLVYARQPENAYFSHAPHVRLAEIACERCHGPHGASERLRPLQRNRLSTYSRDVEGYALARVRTRDHERGMKMTECSRCHRKENVRESCLTCHK